VSFSPREGRQREVKKERVEERWEKGGGRRGREGEPGSWDGLKKSFGKGWRDAMMEREEGEEGGREGGREERRGLEGRRERANGKEREGDIWGEASTGGGIHRERENLRRRRE
jgi:hypothetical protein